MTHDAIVIGAGPAGSVAALLLARAGWSVALVERASFPRRKVCGEYMSATNLPLFRDLGVADAILDRAGPEIRRMGLYARGETLTAPMPRGAGRALGREVLDTVLRDAAVAAGATAFQPWSARLAGREHGLHRVALSCHGRHRTLAARVVIDAGGGVPPATHGGGDLLGFKAHFRNARLAADLMPVVVFPGGYGGLVTTDDGRVTFGCCIRRDVLERVRAGTPAESVLRYVAGEVRGVAETLAGATIEGSWLGTGPIHPGMHRRYRDGVFHVGGAAGETHPLVGEGMSMAMQGAWLLARHLTGGASLDAAGHAYAAAWRRRFAPRIIAAAAFANLAMRRGTVTMLLPILARMPTLLTAGATLSGKTQTITA